MVGKKLISDILKCDPTGRMKADERREQILHTAIDLFSKKGFSGTTTKEIARAAGVSEAIIFRHFSKKSDIYHAILDDKARHDGMKFPWEEDAELLDAIRTSKDLSDDSAGKLKGVVEQVAKQFA